MLLVNRDTWCRAGDYRAPGSLAGMIKQAWCSALGVDVGCHATLVHFPAWPAVWLERDDDTGFQQVLERADYLAKEHTKAHCTGERNLAVAGVEHDWRANTRQTKVWVVVWRQRCIHSPTDCFYVSVPLCDNHSAVTATSLLYPNSSPDFN